MSYHQQGIYSALLDECWHEGSIPSDPGLIAKLLGLDPKRFAAADWPLIATCFKARKDGRLVNVRMEKERRNSLRLLRAQRAAGRASAIKREKNKMLRGNGPSTDRQRTVNHQGQGQGQGQGQRSESEQPNPPSPPQPTPPATIPATPAEPPAGGPGSLRIQDLGGLLHSVDQPRPDLRLRKAVQTQATAVIDEIRKLEIGQAEPFNPGQWWGRHQDKPDAIRLDTLSQLGRRLQAGDRPVSPWAYCETTLREKEANHYGGMAEAESTRRLKAAGRTR
jgi:uncharacterized protein YdaU (DUF1376 family)